MGIIVIFTRREILPGVAISNRAERRGITRTSSASPFKDLLKAFEGRFKAFQRPFKDLRTLKAF